MKRRAKALILTLTLAGSLLVGTAAPAGAATCDDLTQAYCIVMGKVCYVLYRGHVIPDPNCIA